MKKEFYSSKKTFVKFDDKHHILYLNEDVVENYLPENAEENDAPYTAFSYTGPELDGGTKVEATEATYSAFVAGLVRTKYSADDVEAIVLNLQSNIPSRAEEFTQKMEALNAFRQACKDTVAQLLTV